MPMTQDSREQNDSSKSERERWGQGRPWTGAVASCTRVVPLRHQKYHSAFHTASLLLGEGLPMLNVQEGSKAQPADIPKPWGSTLRSSGSSEPMKSVGSSLSSSPSHLLHTKGFPVPSEPGRGGVPQ